MEALKQALERLNRIEEENVNLRNRLFDSNDEIFSLQASLAASDAESKFFLEEEKKKIESELHFKEKELMSLNKIHQSTLIELSNLKLAKANSITSKIENSKSETFESRSPKTSQTAVQTVTNPKPTPNVSNTPSNSTKMECIQSTEIYSIVEKHQKFTSAINFYINKLISISGHKSNPNSVSLEDLYSALFQFSKTIENLIKKSIKQNIRIDLENIMQRTVEVMLKLADVHHEFIHISKDKVGIEMLLPNFHESIMKSVELLQITFQLPKPLIRSYDEKEDYDRTIKSKLVGNLTEKFEQVANHSISNRGYSNTSLLKKAVSIENPSSIMTQGSMEEKMDGDMMNNHNHLKNRHLSMAMQSITFPVPIQNPNEFFSIGVSLCRFHSIKPQTAITFVSSIVQLMHCMMTIQTITHEGCFYPVTDRLCTTIQLLMDEIFLVLRDVVSNSNSSSWFDSKSRSPSLVAFYNLMLNFLFGNSKVQTKNGMVNKNFIGMNSLHHLVDVPEVEAVSPHMSFKKNRVNEPNAICSMDTQPFPTHHTLSHRPPTHGSRFVSPYRGIYSIKTLKATANDGIALGSIQNDSNAVEVHPNPYDSITFKYNLLELIVNKNLSNSSKSLLLQFLTHLLSHERIFAEFMDCQNNFDIDPNDVPLFDPISKIPAQDASSNSFIDHLTSELSIDIHWAMDTVKDESVSFHTYIIDFFMKIAMQYGDQGVRMLLGLPKHLLTNKHANDQNNRTSPSQGGLLSVKSPVRRTSLVDLNSSSSGKKRTINQINCVSEKSSSNNAIAPTASILHSSHEQIKDICSKEDSLVNRLVQYMMRCVHELDNNVLMCSNTLTTAKKKENFERTQILSHVVIKMTKLLNIIASHIPSELWFSMVMSDEMDMIDSFLSSQLRTVTNQIPAIGNEISYYNRYIISVKRVVSYYYAIEEDFGMNNMGGKIELPPLISTIDTYLDIAAQSRAEEIIHEVKKAKKLKKKSTKKSNSVDTFDEPASTASPPETANSNAANFLNSKRPESRKQSKIKPSPREKLISKTVQPHEYNGVQGLYADSLSNPHSPIESSYSEKQKHRILNSFTPGSMPEPSLNASLESKIGFSKAVESVAALKLHNYAIRRRDNMALKLKLLREIRGIQKDNNKEFNEAKAKKRDEILASWKLRYFIEYFRFKNMRDFSNEMIAKNEALKNECNQLNLIIEQKDQELFQDKVTIENYQRMEEDHLKYESRLQSEIDTLNRRIEELNNHITNLDQELMDKHQKVIEENQLKVDELGKSEVLRNELKITRLTCQDLVRNVALKDEEIQRLENLLERKHIDHTQYQSRVTTSVEKAEQDAEILQMRIEDGHGKHYHFDSKVNKQNLLYNAMINERDEIIQRLENNIEILENSMSNTMVQLNETEELLKVERTKNEEHVNHTSSLQKLITDLAVIIKASEEEMEQHKNFVEEHDKMVEETDEKVKRLKKSNKEKSNQLKELQENYVTAQSEIDLLADENEDLAREIECHAMYGEEMDERYRLAAESVQYTNTYSRFLEEQLFHARKLEKSLFADTNYEDDPTRSLDAMDLENAGSFASVSQQKYSSFVKSSDELDQQSILATGSSSTSYRTGSVEKQGRTNMNRSRDNYQDAYNMGLQIGFGQDGDESSILDVNMVLPTKGVLNRKSSINEMTPRKKKSVSYMPPVEVGVENTIDSDAFGGDDTGDESASRGPSSRAATVGKQSFVEQKLFQLFRELESKIKVVDHAAESMKNFAEKVDMMDLTQSSRFSRPTRTALGSAFTPYTADSGTDVNTPPFQSSEDRQLELFEESASTMNSLTPMQVQLKKENFISEHMKLENLFSDIQQKLERVHERIEEQKAALSTLQDRRTSTRRLFSNWRKEFKRENDGREPSDAEKKEHLSGELAAYDDLKAEIKSLKTENIVLNSQSIAMQTELYKLNEDLERSGKKFYRIFGESIATYMPNAVLNAINDIMYNEPSAPNSGTAQPFLNNGGIGESFLDGSTSVFSSSLLSLDDDPFKSMESYGVESEMEGTKSLSTSVRGNAADSMQSNNVSLEPSNAEPLEYSATSVSEVRVIRSASQSMSILAATGLATVDEINQILNDQSQRDKKELNPPTSSGSDADESDANEFSGNENEKMKVRSEMRKDSQVVLRRKSSFPKNIERKETDERSSTENIAIQTPIKTSVKTSQSFSERKEARLVHRQIRDKVASLKGDLEKKIAQAYDSVEELEISLSARKEILNDIIQWMRSFNDLCGYIPDRSDKVRSKVFQSHVESYHAVSGQVQSVVKDALSATASAREALLVLVETCNQNIGNPGIFQQDYQQIYELPTVPSLESFPTDAYDIAYEHQMEEIQSSKTTRSRPTSSNRRFSNLNEPLLPKKMPPSIRTEENIEDQVVSSPTFARLRMKSSYSGDIEELADVPTDLDIIRQEIHSDVRTLDNYSFGSISEHVVFGSRPDTTASRPDTGLSWMSDIPHMVFDPTSASLQISKIPEDNVESVDSDHAQASEVVPSPANNIPINREALKKEFKALKKDLRQWKFDFSNKFGRTPNAQDFDLVDIETRLKIVRRNELKRLLGGAVSAENNSTDYGSGSDFFSKTDDEDASRFLPPEKSSSLSVIQENGKFTIGSVDSVSKDVMVSNDVRNTEPMMNAISGSSSWKNAGITTTSSMEPNPDTMIVGSTRTESYEIPVDVSKIEYGSERHQRDANKFMAAVFNNYDVLAEAIRNDAEIQAVKQKLRQNNEDLPVVRERVPGSRMSGEGGNIIPDNLNPMVHEPVIGPHTTAPVTTTIPVNQKIEVAKDPPTPNTSFSSLVRPKTAEKGSFRPRTSEANSTRPRTAEKDNVGSPSDASEFQASFTPSPRKTLFNSNVIKKVDPGYGLTPTPPKHLKPNSPLPNSSEEGVTPTRPNGSANAAIIKPVANGPFPPAKSLFAKAKERRERSMNVDTSPPNEASNYVDEAQSSEGQPISRDTQISADMFNGMETRATTIASSQASTINDQISSIQVVDQLVSNPVDPPPTISLMEDSDIHSDGGSSTSKSKRKKKKSKKSVGNMRSISDEDNGDLGSGSSHANEEERQREIEVKELKAEYNKLKKIFKTWKTGFLKQYGREPNPQDLLDNTIIDEETKIMIHRKNYLKKIVKEDT